MVLTEHTLEYIVDIWEQNSPAREGFSSELRPHMGPGVNEPPSVLLAEKYHTNTWYTLMAKIIMDSQSGGGEKHVVGKIQRQRKCRVSGRVAQ